MKKTKYIEIRYMYNLKKPVTTSNNWFLFKYLIVAA